MDKLPPSLPFLSSPPSDPTPDLPSFAAPRTGAVPDRPQEMGIGQRDPVRHRQLVEDVCRLRSHLDRVDADASLRGDPRQQLVDLRDLHRLLHEALAHCQFADHDRVRTRADVLMAASRRQAADPPIASAVLPPTSLQAWRREMRSLLELAVMSGSQGLTATRGDGVPERPFDADPPTDLVAAIRFRDAHLQMLDRLHPARSRATPGHDRLCSAQDLLRELRPDDALRNPASLLRWQSALAGAMALETDAITFVRVVGAQPSEAIARMSRYHDM